MFYDLHIHSALSPCSDDDMTLNNIVNMAYIKGLDIIAITDHNSVKQLYHLKEVAKDKVEFVYGVEIQSREEVHILAYFLGETCLDSIQTFLDDYLIEEPNDEYYFGHQYILDENDKIINEEKRLLIKSLDLSIREVIRGIHQLGGVAVLAHAMSERFSIMNVFMKIDKDLDIDGIEVTEIKHQEYLLHQYPYLKKMLWFINSDAHRLDMISEPIHNMDKQNFYEMWRKRYG
ncbi:PHP domain-containing protein [Coprobacillus cateniformis]|uniref:PHP domain-containing protein n=1 Tax=Coprobacillus cateniformis TaxID=100884 RepID=UPI0034A26434